jgi:hypothetical protein
VYVVDANEFDVREPARAPPHANHDDVIDDESDVDEQTTHRKGNDDDDNDTDDKKRPDSNAIRADATAVPSVRRVREAAAVVRAQLRDVRVACVAL